MYSAELGGAARAIQALPSGTALSSEQEEVLQDWAEFLIYNSSQLSLQNNSFNLCNLVT